MTTSTATTQTAPNDDTTPSPSANLPPPSDPYTSALASLQQNGFVILPATLFPTFDLPTLRDAATHLTHLARTSQWPYLRTLPKQFPPWPSDPSNGIWGVQHLLHPSNPHAATFAKSYFDPELLKYAQVLIGCEEEELVMELYNMLVRPDAAFALRWHRDDIPASASAEEELERLVKKEAFHAQWNLALYEDESLVVVPGSHRRARTEEERSADPFEDDMPGQLVVRLKAGEVVFYDNNILHRGVYDPDKERMTLHGSVGSCKKGAGKERARNVLQHGVGSWVGEVDFRKWVGGEIGERAERMRERLVRLGRESGEVGFFSKDE
ncbi:uncharacterized protein EI97DRAFT_493697 [Westerdykella ornata]|uniref:Phytanoyl-CoA dioxygenase family protein n=1 Tax=Westerdykella ornata TaxID=318751 RepID=A0A6A6JQG9_WESOR|nr:uncharacterized protein EI97DRAFT_493697 [Westerdykella ornata]KAF2277209.1 hypothetical protein EI97DRAFT_493697 [Westerdykella ornata]